MAKHEVVRDKAVELFAAMGFKMADKWDDGELMKKVRKISDIVPDGFDPDPELADVYLGLTEALGAGEDVELVDVPEDPVELLDDDDAEIGGEGKEDVPDADPDQSEQPAAKEDAAGEGKPDSQEPSAPDDSESPAVVEAPKKSKRPKKNNSPSNKARIYEMYLKDGESAKNNVDDYHKLIGEAVKATTIKAWVAQWKNGKNLPASAKDQPA